MYTRRAFSAESAPKPNGNYSHAVLQQSATLHVAGWMGDDPSTGNIVEGGIGAQTVSPMTAIPRTTESARLTHQFDSIKPCVTSNHV